MHHVEVVQLFSTIEDIFLLRPQKDIRWKTSTSNAQLYICRAKHGCEEKQKRQRAQTKHIEIGLKTTKKNLQAGRYGRA